MMRPATFAIPGDIATVTGGYIYERRLLHGLRALGHDVTHLQLAASFPDPEPHHMTEAVDALVAIRPEHVLILDGLIYGSVETAGLARVRAPIVAMIHHPLALETGLSDDRKRHLFETERANLALARHVLVPSPHTAEILARHYGVPTHRMTIAQPGTERPVTPRRPSDPPLILSVGIQHPRKGHDILLRALSRLTDAAWRAVIVGSVHDADHGADLARMVADLGLGDRVTFTGRLAQDDLNGLFAEASIFALATRYEGYGMVFDEALAWGLPIVTCATGAVPDTVPKDAGLLVPAEASEALSEALLKLLADTPLCRAMAQASARAGASLPTWEDTARTASGVLGAV